MRRIRAGAQPGLMEVFLAEYGLSTEEGIALMCLAEALLRVPDAETMDALIEDKIAPSDWGRHLGRSASSLVNASTWALMLTGKVLEEDREPGIAGHLRAAVQAAGRAGDPHRGRPRDEGDGAPVRPRRDHRARRWSAPRGMEAKGYSYSYDMLGEAARTEADARRYQIAYSRAIGAIAAACKSPRHPRDNPGISVKLSALHPRYEVAKRERVMAELVPRVAGAGRAGARPPGWASTSTPRRPTGWRCRSR